MSTTVGAFSIDDTTSGMVTAESTDVPYSNVTAHLPAKQLNVVPVVLMFASGAIGNILAIIILLVSAKKHKWRTFYRLVGALAVSDFLGLVGTLPISINAYANNKMWIGGQPLCDFMSFMLIFAGMASAMLACAMSMDRLVAVCFPYFYNIKLTKLRVNLILAGLWIVAFLVACLPLFGLNANVRQFPGTWCFFDHFSMAAKDKFFAYFYAFLGILMIVVMLFGNMIVIVKLAKRCGDVKSPIGAHRAGRSRLNDVYNMVFLVVLMVVFTICWVPLCVRILINQNLPDEPDRASDLLVMRLALVNQILDPWIYIILRKDVIKWIVKFGKRHTKENSVFNQIDDEDDTTSNTRQTGTSLNTNDSRDSTEIPNVEDQEKVSNIDTSQSEERNINVTNIDEFGKVKIIDILNVDSQQKENHKDDPGGEGPEKTALYI